MAIVRLGAYTPAANTSYALYNVTTSYLVSVIAANTLTSSSTTTTVDIWVVPQGVSDPSGYAYITSKLTVGLGQSFETFKFGVNAGDTILVKSTTAGTSFVVQGMDQNNEYSINNVPITFTNKIIRGNNNVIYPAIGTTAERPASAETGYWRYNTDLNYIEFKTPTGWAAATGATGPQGLRGIAGTGLYIKGSYSTLNALQSAFPTGTLGDAYLVGVNLYVWDSTLIQWTNAGPVVGPTGPTGPSGGPTGPTGPAGVVGATGPAGKFTASSAQPPTSVQGEVWFNTTNSKAYVYNNGSFVEIMGGSVGATGATGPTGPSGGPTGPTGPSGAAGATGISIVDNFQVTNSGTAAYLINGVSNSGLTLVRGQSYFFTVNASGHPFWIQTTSGAYSSGNVYSTGVTNGGAAVGGITFTVPAGAPNTLYYVCQMHATMGGIITVIG